MRPRATLQGVVGSSLRAGQNPFMGRIRPEGPMLPMLVLKGVDKTDLFSNKMISLNSVLQIVLWFYFDFFSNLGLYYNSL